MNCLTSTIAFNDLYLTIKDARQAIWRRYESRGRRGRCIAWIIHEDSKWKRSISQKSIREIMGLNQQALGKSGVRIEMERSYVHFFRSRQDTYPSCRHFFDFDFKKVRTRDIKLLRTGVNRLMIIADSRYRPNLHVYCWILDQRNRTDLNCLALSIDFEPLSLHLFENLVLLFSCWIDLQGLQHRHLILFH